MLQYDITMEHNEDSLVALSHMQYDLFCTRNFIARNLLSLVAIAVGAMYFSRFWGIALVAFPSSRYCFTDKGIEITFHPGKPDEEKLTPVGYGEILKLGEDLNFFYLFPTPNGGYCIPKTALGEKQKDFVSFVEWKTGKKFYRRRPSLFQRIRDWFRERNSEPEHL